MMPRSCNTLRHTATHCNIIYANMHACVYAFMHACMHTHIHYTYIRTHTQTHISTNTQMKMHRYMHACIYTYILSCMPTDIHTYTHKHTHTHTHTRYRRTGSVRMHTYIRSHPHTRTPTHTHKIWTQDRKRVFVSLYVYMQVYTCIPACLHIYTHTLGQQACAYMYICKYLGGD